MSASARIRPFAVADRDPVASLLRAAANFNDAELAIADELMGAVLSQPEQKDYYAFIAEGDASLGTPVAGFLILGPVPATTGSWHLYWIAVHPRWQGTGVGRQLDEWAAEFVRAHGGYWLLAETSSQPSYERARSFYRKQGYRLLTRIEDYYKPLDDLLVFGRRL